jgi:hypothetical protein
MDKILHFSSNNLDEYATSVDLDRNVQVKQFLKIRLLLLIKSHERVTKPDAADPVRPPSATTNMLFIQRLIDSEINIMKSIIQFFDENGV